MLPLATLAIMLVVAGSLLIVAQFPASLSSRRTRILLGLLASCLLGLGSLALGAPIPAFVAVLAVVATLPRIRRHRPSLVGFCLAVLYVIKRIVFYTMVYDEQLKVYEVSVDKDVT